MRFRITAFLYHLTVSALVLSVFLSIVFFIWYPSPYYILMSAVGVLTTLVMVDLVLGPSLTLITFNEKKSRRELTLDMSLILLVQITALIWGGLTVHYSRPQFTVYAQNAYYVMTQNDINMDELSDHVTAPHLFQGPKLVYARPPETESEIQEVYKQMTQKDSKAFMFEPGQYVEMDHEQAVLPTQGLDLSLISQPDNKILEAWLAELTGNSSDELEKLLFLPVYGRDRKYLGAISIDNGRLLSALIYAEVAKK